MTAPIDVWMVQVSILCPRCVLISDHDLGYVLAVDLAWVSSFRGRIPSFAPSIGSWTAGTMTIPRDCLLTLLGGATLVTPVCPSHQCKDKISLANRLLLFSGGTLSLTGARPPRRTTQHSAMFFTSFPTAAPFHGRSRGLSCLAAFEFEGTAGVPRCASSHVCRLLCSILFLRPREHLHVYLLFLPVNILDCGVRSSFRSGLILRRSRTQLSA
ncbi:hypothetical protein BKA93DRAFT_47388 [Sparassis latifolia]